MTAFSSTPRTMFEKIWDSHVVHAEPGKQADSVHRPAPGPRSDQPPGLRGAAAGRPQGAPARADRGHARPQHPHHRPPLADRRSDLEAADRHAAGQLPRVRRPAVRSGRRPAGDRARHRPGTGPDAAGHDDRLRRQPHGHARGVRRAGLRHRHQRSRARAGHANAVAIATQDVRDPRRRPLAARRDGQGSDPLPDRPDHHRRRHRLRHRIHRQRRSAA